MGGHVQERHAAAPVGVRGRPFGADDGPHADLARRPHARRQQALLLARRDQGQVGPEAEDHGAAAGGFAASAEAQRSHQLNRGIPGRLQGGPAAFNQVADHVYLAMVHAVRKIETIRESAPRNDLR